MGHGIIVFRGNKWRKGMEKNSPFLHEYLRKFEGFVEDLEQDENILLQIYRPRVDYAAAVGQILFASHYGE
jgi:hypothetical protein